MLKVSFSTFPLSSSLTKPLEKLSSLLPAFISFNLANYATVEMHQCCSKFASVSLRNYLFFGGEDFILNPDKKNLLNNFVTF